ncbi:hypothetical protein MP638_002676 [Amoeboaphelidium occidentale]|nr:hypothetical protein MP638_002676 [Amoeboaphelidium occidentale]
MIAQRTVCALHAQDQSDHNATILASMAFKEYVRIANVFKHKDSLEEFTFPQKSSFAVYVPQTKSASPALRGLMNFQDQPEDGWSAHVDLEIAEASKGSSRAEMFTGALKKLITGLNPDIALHRLHLIFMDVVPSSSSDKFSADTVKEVINAFLRQPGIQLSKQLHLKISYVCYFVPQDPDQTSSSVSSTPLNINQPEQGTVKGELWKCGTETLLQKLLFLVREEFGLRFFQFFSKDSQSWFFGRFACNLDVVSMMFASVDKGNGLYSLQFDVIQEVNMITMKPSIEYEPMALLTHYPAENWKMNEWTSGISEGVMYWVIPRSSDGNTSLSVQKLLLVYEKTHFILKKKKQVSSESRRDLNEIFKINEIVPSTPSDKNNKIINENIKKQVRMNVPYLPVKQTLASNASQNADLNLKNTSGFGKKTIEGRLPNFRPQGWTSRFTDDRKTWEKTGNSSNDINQGGSNGQGNFKKRKTDTDEVIGHKVTNGKQFYLVVTKKGDKQWMPAETPSIAKAIKVFWKTRPKYDASVELVEF